MNHDNSQTASPRGEPKNRKRRDSPSRRAGKLAAKAAYTRRRIESVSRERQDAWAQGDRPLVTERATGELDTLHDRKRRLYAEAPQVALIQPSTSEATGAQSDGFAKTDVQASGDER